MKNQDGPTILIKIGSGVILKDNKLDKMFLQDKVKEISKLSKEGTKIILVSSGAVAMGMEIEHLDKRPSDTTDLQLLSGKGQVRLMSKYIGYFKVYGIDVAQILLTSHNFRYDKEVTNFKGIIRDYTLRGDMPIINANDVITKDELISDVFHRFSDNDQLAVLVAILLNVDKIVILTNVDGLYTDNPFKNPNAKLIREVDHVTSEIEKISKKGTSDEGLGGMHSKVMSAKKAMEKGITTIVANGKYHLKDILENKVNCTVFRKKI
jgi:glutamate 5-kinase